MSLLNWIDDRFPLTKVWNEHMAQYYAPKNFNVWYFFGALSLVCWCCRSSPASF